MKTKQPMVGNKVQYNPNYDSGYDDGTRIEGTVVDKVTEQEEHFKEAKHQVPGFEKHYVSDGFHPVTKYLVEHRNGTMATVDPLALKKIDEFTKPKPIVRPKLSNLKEFKEELRKWYNVKTDPVIRWIPAEKKYVAFFKKFKFKEHWQVGVPTSKEEEFEITKGLVSELKKANSFRRFLDTNVFLIENKNILDAEHIIADETAFSAAWHALELERKLLDMALKYGTISQNTYYNMLSKYGQMQSNMWNGYLPEQGEFKLV